VRRSIHAAWDGQSGAMNTASSPGPGMGSHCVGTGFDCLIEFLRKQSWIKESAEGRLTMKLSDCRCNCKIVAQQVSGRKGRQLSPECDEAVSDCDGAGDTRNKAKRAWVETGAAPPIAASGVQANHRSYHRLNRMLLALRAADHRGHVLIVQSKLRQRRYVQSPTRSAVKSKRRGDASSNRQAMFRRARPDAAYRAKTG